MAIAPADIQAKRTEITAEGTFFELESVTVDGFTYRAYKHASKTAIDVILSARNHGDLEFMVYEGRRYTYTQYFQLVDALAASLQLDYGIVAGDRVAIAMRNNPEWVISYAAATLAGAIVVLINSWGKTEELVHAVADAGSKLLVCDRPRLNLISGELLELNLDVILVDDSDESINVEKVQRFESVISGAGRDYEICAAVPDDPCVMLYTSGSTGFPKGALHTHRAVGQALMNFMWMGMLVAELEGGAREYKGGAEREAYLLTVPLFHATGLLAGYLLPIQMGQKVVMMDRWDSGRALQLIQDEKITGLTSVPAIIQDLLSHSAFAEFDTESLIRVSAAGAATPRGLPDLIAEKIGSASRSAGYGMTETLGVGGAQSGIIFDLKPEASGIISPLMDMRMVDADGRVLPPGQAGEIEFKGITCTPGYWDKPEANASTFDDQRWMKSGDVGYIDEDGFIHITGRIKEIVIRGGENIYPGEIEAAAYEMGAAQEVVVFGEPDDAMGEELVMVLYVRPENQLTEDELRGFLKQRLAAYKVPRTIRFADKPLPRNASEKLHKLKVREAFLAD